MGIEPRAVLFVCLGNICRSPMADAVFRHLVNEADLAHEFLIDSAGTGSWHLGSPPHPETQSVLVEHGIDPLASRGARQVRSDDFQRFSHIVAMDSTNYTDLRDIGGGFELEVAELSMLLEHADEQIITDVLGPESDRGSAASAPDVPDPYYVGGYDKVYKLVRSGCEGLLEALLQSSD